MTTLLHFDESLFSLINQGCATLVLDVLLPLVRNKFLWFPLYVFIACFLMVNFGKKGALAIVALILLITVTDQMSSQVLKKSIKRLRPCQLYEASKEVRVLVPCGSGYSFPSSHAANHFAFAVFIGGLLAPWFRWVKQVLILWAGLISFAQVYVGVHFPLDVFAGAVLGSMLGWLFLHFYAKYIGLEAQRQTANNTAL